MKYTVDKIWLIWGVVTFSPHFFVFSQVSNDSTLLGSANYIKSWKIDVGGHNDRKILTLLALFELSGDHDGSGNSREHGFSEMTAAHLALNDINRKQILPGYQLTMVTNDTQVSWNNLNCE